MFARHPCTNEAASDYTMPGTVIVQLHPKVRGDLVEGGVSRASLERERGRGRERKVRFLAGAFEFHSNHRS